MKKSVEEKMKVRKSKCITILMLFLLLILFVMLFGKESQAAEKYGEFYEIKDNCITRILPETTLKDLKNNLENEEIYVTKADGTELSDTDYVGTGMQLNDGTNIYTLSVIGDIDGNGKITITDAIKINLHKNNLKKLEGVYVLSSDINNDGKVSITDTVQINLILVKIKDIVAPETPIVDGNVSENSITVSGNTTDKNGGSIEYFFKIDDGEWVQNTDKTNGTYTFTDVNRNINHVIIIKVRDKSGNEKKSEKIIIEGSVTNEIEYTVIHKQMDIDGENYTTVETENETVASGTSVTPAVKTYEGFTAPSTQTKIISETGNNTITYLYERNKYTFTLGTGTGVDTTGSSTTGEYYHGATITLALSATEGYENPKWTSSNTTLVPSPTSANTTFTMPIGNITMTPSATESIVNGIFATLYDTDNDGTGDKLIYTANNRTIDTYGDKIEQYNLTGGIIGFSSNNIPWYSRRENITSAKIEDNIQPTSGRYLFSDLSRITNIENIGKLDTSNITDMSSMFYNCDSLTELDVSNFDTSEVTNMSFMFASVNGNVLESIDTTNFNTNKVTDMAGIYMGCKNITSLDLSSFNTGNVTDMHSMFRDCNNLISITFSDNFNTSNVTDMFSMFCSCNSLISITFNDNFDTSNVTNMNSMFEECNSLTSLDVSCFNITNIEYYYQIFKNCANIEAIYGNPTWQKVNDTPNGAFDNCGTDHVIIDFVKYAVQVYGINQDVDENDNVLGLTFGPAAGANYNNAFVTHEYEETAEGSGIYNVKIVTHTIASDRTETTTTEYLKNSSGENVTRTTAEKNKYDVNMHNMTWAEIEAIEDKTAFTDCMLCGDTKSVMLTLNSTIASGQAYDQYGDGAGSLNDSIADYYKKWNPSSSDNLAAINGGSFGSNAKSAGGYRTSHIRASLIGADVSNPDITYAGDVNLDSSTCLYSCIESNLRDVITAKKLKYVTGESTINYQQNSDIADKIWLFSDRELYGTGDFSGDTVEGLGINGDGYDKFRNTNSKYYLLNYTNDSTNSINVYCEFNQSDFWWLRSPHLGNTDGILLEVYDIGTSQFGLACGENKGLTFGFCIK